MAAGRSRSVSFSAFALGLGIEAEKQSSFRWWVINRLIFLVAANNLAGFMVFFLQERFPSL